MEKAKKERKGKKQKNRSKYKENEKTKGENRMIACEKCGKKFKKNGLPRHRAACTGERKKRPYTRKIRNLSTKDLERRLIEQEVRMELAAKILLGV